MVCQKVKLDNTIFSISPNQGIKIAIDNNIHAPIGTKCRLKDKIVNLLGQILKKPFYS